MRGWWQHWRQQAQQRKAQRYLYAHPALALDALRQDPALATASMQAFWMQAAADAERQTAQFPILNQLGLGARTPLVRHLPKVTPFNLRRFSEYPPARRAINALCNPIVDLDWSIQPIVPLDQDQRQPGQPTPDQQRRITLATSLLERPNDSTERSWRTLLEVVLEDLVVGGYGAIEVVQTGHPRRPYQFFAVDGQSIRVNAAWHGDPQEYHYSQSLSYVGMTVGTHNVVDLYDQDLLYLRLNPRSHTPFGLGYLESAFLIVNAWLSSFEYAERRASNATPNFGIFLGENVDMVTARKWQKYWEQEIEGYGKIPFIAGGKQPAVFNLSGTGEDQLYLRWQEHLIRVIAMAFGLSPMKLGLERDVNRTTAETAALSDLATAAPVANTVSDVLTTQLLWGIFGWADLRFHWGQQAQDAGQQADILSRRYAMNSITIDEIRAIYGDQPLPDGQGAVTKSVYEARAAQAPLPAPAGPAAVPADDFSAVVRQAEAILRARQRPARNGTHAVP